MTFLATKKKKSKNAKHLFLPFSIHKSLHSLTLNDNLLIITPRENWVTPSAALLCIVICTEYTLFIIPTRVYICLFTVGGEILPIEGLLLVTSIDN